MGDGRWQIEDGEFPSPIYQMPSAKILSGFPRHDDPKDQVNDHAGEGGEDGEDGVEDADQGGIPAEPFGQAAAHAADHAVVRKHPGHGGVVSPWFFFVQ